MIKRFIDEIKYTRAHGAVNSAIKRGVLTRAKTCQICGDTPPPIKCRKYVDGDEIINRASICAHHWNGHDNVYDIWWVCNWCNAILKGPHFHCGYVTVEQARLYIKRYKKRHSKSNLKKSLLIT